MIKQNKNLSPEQISALKGIPAISAVIEHQAVRALKSHCPDLIILRIARQVIEDKRNAVISGNETAFRIDLENVVAEVVNTANEAVKPRLMRSVNAAGVILHTGLGRAPLPLAAQKAISEAAQRYCLLALDRSSGKRGDRYSHVEDFICDLTNCEAAVVVNNNSAALILALNTLAEGKQTIVSRGELVEIGGSFRLPEVMQRSGTIMVEVGTTNKTHLKDYEKVINPETAVILKVHTSNYRIEGFTQETPVKKLAELSQQNNLILIHDIGSGALIDLRRWGFDYEPTVPEAIRDGADIVTFSGDKLLGGPQCGIIAGKRDMVARIKRNPLMRALRCDKLTLSALAGTLLLFYEPDKLPQTHPIYAMLTEGLTSVSKRAQKIAKLLRSRFGETAEVKIFDTTTEIGSGSLPARGLATRAVSLRVSGIDEEQLVGKLRMGRPPVFTRIENNAVVFDARTIARDEIDLLKEALTAIKL